MWLYLVPDKSHDSDASEDVLSIDRLTGNTIRICVTVGVVWFTEMPHKQVHIGTEGRGEERRVSCHV